MTDITELAQSLKVAAEKATPGPWVVKDYFWLAPKSEVFSGEFVECHNGPDAQYLKLLSPENVLALVEALEKAQQRNGELETYSKTTLEFREAARDENRHLKLELEIAEKRIAELEESHAQVIQSRDHYKRMSEEGLKQLAKSRTVNPEDTDGVREEDNKFLVVRHPGNVPVIKHPVGHLEDYLLQILKADPLATIDIVTHRYYGVGGQFVEDADEYLHEMGIKWEAE